MTLKVAKGLLCSRMILPAFFIMLANASWGQTQITICSESYYVVAAGMPAAEGQWHVVFGNGVFSPETNRATTISSIGIGENRYWYDGPGGNEYFINITRVVPLIYSLSGPDFVCGNNQITLTLSGSDNDYIYFLYKDGAQFAGAPVGGISGTGSSLIY